jgi:hypothetical protein
MTVLSVRLRSRWIPCASGAETHAWRLFLVVDEASSLTYVDRLSVQNWCRTGNAANGIVNSDSGDCI